MRRLMALALVVAGFGAARVAGQQPAFEAASIKLNKLGAARGGRLQPGRFEQTSVTLRDLIGMAYGRRQISGAPNWIDTDRFDVMATGRLHACRISSRQRRLAAGCVCDAAVAVDGTLQADRSCGD